MLEKIRSAKNTIRTHAQTIIQLRESIIESESSKLLLLEDQQRQLNKDSIFDEQLGQDIAMIKRLVATLSETNRLAKAIAQAKRTASKSNLEQIHKQSLELSVQLKKAQASAGASMEPLSRATLSATRDMLKQKTIDVEALESAFLIAHSRLEQERAQVNRLNLELQRLHAKENSVHSDIKNSQEPQTKQPDLAT